MSVRRLAPDEIQPESFAFTAENERWAEREIQKYPPGRQMSAVIPLLWQAQEQAGGWLPQKAIEFIADRLGMATIRVLEVATFYTMFNLEPVGRHFVQLCGTVPCHVKGALELKEVLRRRIGAERHVTKDGLFSWLEVECLGACCNAPMVQINADYYEDLTPEILEAMLDDLAAGRAVKPGPQQGRVSSEPDGDVKTLHDAALFDGSLIGAWRKRFDEEPIKEATPTGEAAAGDRDGAVRAEARQARFGPRHRARGGGHAGEARQGGRADDVSRQAAGGVRSGVADGDRARPAAGARPGAGRRQIVYGDAGETGRGPSDGEGQRQKPRNGSAQEGGERSVGSRAHAGRPADGTQIAMLNDRDRIFTNRERSEASSGLTRGSIAGSRR